MAEKVYYWIGPGQFGGGENGVKFGEVIKGLDADRQKSFLEKGWISTEKQIPARQLSELEQLREENAKLKKEGGSGITQEQLDAAKAESAQADLDKLELITEAVKNIQQGDNKEELWKCIKEVKELLK